MVTSKVRNSTLVTLLFLFLVGTGIGRASEGPQTVYEKTLTFTITQTSNDRFKTKATVYEQQTCLNVRPVDDRWIVLYEPGHGKMSQVRSTLNREPLAGKYRSVETYEGGDVFLSDAKVHYLFYPETPKINDLMAYEFVQDFDDIGYLPMLHLRNLDSQAVYHVVYNHPANVTVDFDIYLCNPSAEYQIERPTNKQTSIYFRPLAKRPQLYVYPFNDLHAVIIPMVTQQELETPSDPVHFIRWYAKEVDLEPRLDTVMSLPWLDSLRALSSPVEQLKGIHDWVRHNIRYLFDSRDDHSIYPHKPAYVLARSFGDCKDRAYLICALARELGLTVHMGLVSTEIRAPMKALHIGLFNHVICYYQDSTREIFFDPTARHHELEDPPETIVGHPALILDPQQPRLLPVTTDWSTPSMEFSFEAHIDSLKQARGTIIIRRDQMAAIRFNQAEQSGRSLQEMLNEYVTTCLPQIPFSNCKVTENGAREMTISADADLSRFVINTPSSRYVTRTPLSFDTGELLQRANDTLALFYERRRHVTLELRLRGATAASDVDSLSFGNDSTGFYRAICKRTDTGLEISYEVRKFAKVLSGDAKTATLEHWRRYLAEKKNMFVISGVTQ